MTNQTRAERNIAWIEEYLIVPSGVKAGQPFKLLDFQKDFLKEVYDKDAMSRLSALSVARKNGKTTLLAVIGLLHLVGPEAKKGGKIYATAATSTMLKVQIDVAWKIVIMSPKLKHLVHRLAAHTRLRCERYGSVYEGRLLKSILGSEQADLPDVLLCEEAGMIRGALPFGPDMVAIAASTNGIVTPNVFSDMLSQIKSRPDENAFVECACPDDVYWKSDKALRVANPAAGEFLNWDDLCRGREWAMSKPEHEAYFKSLYLNQHPTVEQLYKWAKKAIPLCLKYMEERDGKKAARFNADIFAKMLDVLRALTVPE